MRPHGLLVEAAHLDVEILLDLLAQRPGGIARGGVEIDVGVPILDLRRFHDRTLSHRRTRLTEPSDRSPVRACLLGFGHHELRFLRRPEAAQGAGSQIPRRQVPDQGRAPRARRQRDPCRGRLERTCRSRRAGHRHSGSVRRPRPLAAGALRRRRGDRPRRRAGAVRHVGRPGDRGAEARGLRGAEEEVAADAGVGRGDRHARRRRGAAAAQAARHPHDLRRRAPQRQEGAGGRRRGRDLRGRAGQHADGAG